MDDEPRTTSQEPAGEYVVVARRYRPQAFAELVGQQHVAQALASAIQTNRVGHAYLFTGARGVGKTSAARILAKALNCVEGPTATPCNECDICRAITAGDDVDVIEIDGASNRGIDDIRQLRQNVNVRPSRARFKVYIIDEVHMLSRDAFNALLKTLEEPPEHVKFIFCTTEPEKIPITILSRCQRFDFAGVATSMIAERLRQIVTTEGRQVDPEAIDLLARRAAGSMRDSQSLLEQILASGGATITIDDVQRLLGIAADARLTNLVDHLTARNAAGALAELDTAVRQGVDVGQVVDQLLGYLRDLLAASVGCPAESLMYAPPSRTAEILALGPQIGVHTLLAMLQIVEQAAWRLKQTTHGRTVVEMALVRICRLEDLEDLATLVEQLGASGGGSNVAPAPRPAIAPPRPAVASPPPSRPPANVDVKKNDELKGTNSEFGIRNAEISQPIPPVEETPVTTAKRDADASEHAAFRTPHSALSLSDAAARELWQRALGEFHDLLANHASTADRITGSGNRVTVGFSKKYNLPKSFCERPEQATRLTQALSAAAGGPVTIQFVTLDEPVVEKRPQVNVGPSQVEKRREKEQQPFVRKALQMFDARVVRVEEEA
jgi:DNA polymerase-3 subunit gamma/tau